MRKFALVATWGLALSLVAAVGLRPARGLTKISPASLAVDPSATGELAEAVADLTGRALEEILEQSTESRSPDADVQDGENSIDRQRTATNQAAGLSRGAVASASIRPIVSRAPPRA